MGDESVKAKDDVTLVLYDKDGKVKQVASNETSKEKRLKKIIAFLRWFLEKW